MYTLEEAHSKLDDWYDKGCIGNIYFYRFPGGEEVDCFLEETVKLREMTAGEDSDLRKAFGHWRFTKAEIFRDKDDDLDRVKFVRRW